VLRQRNVLRVRTRLAEKYYKCRSHSCALVSICVTEDPEALSVRGEETSSRTSCAS
jgi:hypothetical protein